VKKISFSEKVFCILLSIGSDFWNQAVVLGLSQWHLGTSAGTFRCLSRQLGTPFWHLGILPSETKKLNVLNFTQNSNLLTQSLLSLKKLAIPSTNSSSRNYDHFKLHNAYNAPKMQNLNWLMLHKWLLRFKKLKLWLQILTICIKPLNIDNKMIKMVGWSGKK
jgi:hypothetical protein